MRDTGNVAAEKKMPERLEIGRSNREPAVLQVALNSAV